MSEMKQSLVYLANELYCIVPQCGMSLFHYDPQLDEVYVPSQQTELLGREILQSLKAGVHYASVEERRKLDRERIAEDFDELIKRFRAKTGLSKKKFEEGVQLLIVTQVDNKIILDPMKQARGRLVFDGILPTEQKPKYKMDVTAQEIGQKVASYIEAT